MRRIGSASPDTQDEQTALAVADAGQSARHFFDGVAVELTCNVAHFREEFIAETHPLLASCACAIPLPASQQQSLVYQMRGPSHLTCAELRQRRLPWRQC